MCGSLASRRRVQLSRLLSPNPSTVGGVYSLVRKERPGGLP
jgi:hypothetical protein